MIIYTHKITQRDMKSKTFWAIIMSLSCDELQIWCKFFFITSSDPVYELDENNIEWLGLDPEYFKDILLNQINQTMRVRKDTKYKVLSFPNIYPHLRKKALNNLYSIDIWYTQIVSIILESNNYFCVSKHWSQSNNRIIIYCPLKLS